MERWRLCSVVCAVVCLVAAGSACAEKTVKGTLVSPPSEAGFIRVEVDGNVTAIKPSPDAKIMRGQVGKEILDVELQEFATGDHIVAVVLDAGVARSVKAFYGRVQGVVARIEGQTLTLDDARTVKLADQAQVALPDGKVGTSADLKPGVVAICRVNPITSEAWTVVATSIPKVEQPTASQPKPDDKPKIRSVTYSAPDPLKGGDLITVDLAGNPGGKASFEIKRLVGVTSMKEVSPGSYRAVVEVPKDKTVIGAPLIGRLTVKDEQAPPVQASRLITAIGKPADPPKTEPKPAANSTPDTPPAPPTPPEPGPVPTVSQPKATEPANSECDGESELTKLLLQPPVATQPEDDTTPDSEVAVVSETPHVTIAVPTIVVPIRDADNPEPPAPRADAKVTLTNPPDGATIMRSILVRGNADPDSRVRVEITYTNGKTGILKLAGLAVSQDLAVGDDGAFRMGPIALEGPLATQGLAFTIKAYYPERDDHGTTMVKVIGGRD